MSRPPVSAADLSSMNRALSMARLGAVLGEVPVGAVVTVEDEIVAEAHNETVVRKDLTQHAELIAIQLAMEVLGLDRLQDATLYVTLEPCAQCAGSIVLARIGRVLFGAYDEKAGMAGSVEDLLRHPRLNHHPEVRGGVMEAESSRLLSDFFSERRRPAN